jgi:hypothetical protein
MIKGLTLGLTLTTLIISPLSLAEESTTSTDETQLNTYRQAIKQLGGSLKGELQEAMKAGGPIAALEICHDKAPEISSEVSQNQGFSVGRTSLKPRNSNNAPKPWQIEVLEQFEARKAAGEDVKKLEYYEIVDKDDGGHQVRYMKAIPTAQVCLACHGSEMAPEIVSKLDELYPEDKARGFQVGDIRGAFSIISDGVSNKMTNEE